MLPRLLSSADFLMLLPFLGGKKKAGLKIIMVKVREDQRGVSATFWGEEEPAE